MKVATRCFLSPLARSPARSLVSAFSSLESLWHDDEAARRRQRRPRCCPPGPESEGTRDNQRGDALLGAASCTNVCELARQFFSFIVSHVVCMATYLSTFNVLKNSFTNSLTIEQIYLNRITKTLFKLKKRCRLILDSAGHAYSQLILKLCSIIQIST